MQQYDKAIHNINQILKRGEAKDPYEQEALEFAMDVLEREHKTINILDTAYSCEKCGQISSAKDININTEEYFKDRNYEVKPIDAAGFSFNEYICPKCRRRVFGKEFKKLK